MKTVVPARRSQSRRRAVLMTGTSRLDLGDELSRAGWQVVTVPEPADRPRRMRDVLATAFRERRGYDVAQVDVCHGREFLAAELVGTGLRLLRKPFVLTLHGGRLPEFAARWPRRVRCLLAAARAVTVPSRHVADQMRAYREDLRIVPNALDLGAYEFRLRQSPQPRLVWLRAFREVHNPCLAVHVLAALAKEQSEVRLTMLGPDKGDRSRQRTEQLAEVLGVTGRLLLPGTAADGDAVTALQSGDVFLNTTNADNTAISLIEAMACGLCVVSTDVSALPCRLENEREALLVPADDPAAMTAAVRRVLRDQKLADRLSRNARAKAGEYAWSVVLPQWEEILATVGAPTEKPQTVLARTETA